MRAMSQECLSRPFVIDGHRHDFLLDIESVHTDDGEPQPRESIFLECVECDYIVRDYDIVRVIENAEMEFRNLQVRYERLLARCERQREWLHKLEVSRRELRRLLTCQTTRF